MTIDSKPAKILENKSTKSLTKVLRQNESAKILVEEAAEDLSTANAVLKEGLADQDAPPALEKAIEKSAIAEVKIQEASEELAAVNQALGHEIKDRQVLEFQYAAATEQKDAARHESLHDPLTGLPNRALFNDRLEHGLAQSERHGWSLAVMFIELDDFKIINDTHGHDAGDKVLRTIAARLKENTRSDDTVSRYGGDEFLYLLMEAGGANEVRLTAEKLIAVIGAPCDLNVKGVAVSISVSASIGIAIFPRHGVKADALIKSADAAMYRAKKLDSRCAFAD